MQPMSTHTTGFGVLASEVRIGDQLNDTGHVVYEIGPSITTPGAIAIAAGYDGEVTLTVVYGDEIVLIR